MCGKTQSQTASCAEHMSNTLLMQTQLLLELQ
jgi:hypothetical protein